MPNKPYGGLVASISDNSEKPDSSGVFFVGALDSLRATKSGYLWFTVNDVQWHDNRFYNDNIGYFLVTVSVIKAK